MGRYAITREFAGQPIPPVAEYLTEGGGSTFARGEHNARTWDDLADADRMLDLLPGPLGVIYMVADLGQEASEKG